jgi:hypothetical protein
MPQSNPYNFSFSTNPFIHHSFIITFYKQLLHHPLLTFNLPSNSYRFHSPSASSAQSSQLLTSCSSAVTPNTNSSCSSTCSPSQFTTQTLMPKTYNLACPLSPSPTQKMSCTEVCSQPHYPPLPYFSVSTPIASSQSSHPNSLKTTSSAPSFSTGSCTLKSFRKSHPLVWSLFHYWQFLSVGFSRTSVCFRTRRCLTTCPACELCAIVRLIWFCWVCCLHWG